MKKIQKHFFIPEMIQLAIHHTNRATEMVDKLEANTSKNIHELRVVCKRLRAYHRAVNPMLADKSLTLVSNERLKIAAQSLSKNRESYVNFKLINSFEEATEDPQNKEFYHHLKAKFDAFISTNTIDKTRLLSTFKIENTYWSNIAIASLKPGRAWSKLTKRQENWLKSL